MNRWRGKHGGKACSAISTAEHNALQLTASSLRFAALRCGFRQQLKAGVGPSESSTTGKRIAEDPWPEPFVKIDHLAGALAGCEGESNDRASARATKQVEAVMAADTKVPFQLG
jgi:hypothetical protein